jgi:hypothetical protein
MIERRAWAVVCWLMAAGAAAATNQLSDEEIEGRNIVQHLRLNDPRKTSPTLARSESAMPNASARD